MAAMSPAVTRIKELKKPLRNVIGFHCFVHVLIPSLFSKDRTVTKGVEGNGLDVVEDLKAI